MNTLELIASSLAIVGSLYGFYQWMKMRPWVKKPSRVFAKDSNLHVVYPNGETKQITFLGVDHTPVLGKTGVVFFRGEKIQYGKHVYTRYKLMSIDFSNLSEKVVTDQKPFSDGLNGSYEILQPGHPVLSENHKLVFFTIEKWATALELVQVELKTGKWTELFSVEYFEIIKSGKYKGKLLVGVSEIRDRGRDVYYKVCDYAGSTLLDLGDHDKYMEFRSSAMIRE